MFRRKSNDISVRYFNHSSALLCNFHIMENSRVAEVYSEHATPLCGRSGI